MKKPLPPRSYGFTFSTASQSTSAKHTPDFDERFDLNSVLRCRAAIASGRYDTPEKIDAAIEKLCFKLAA
jgi:hypothetical protein